MSLFRSEFEGELTLDPLPDDFADRIRRRVEAGLLIPGHRERADYQVTGGDRESVTFTARGFLTVYNVGLNDVTVTRSGRGQVRYQVSYQRWTRYAVAHGLIMGAVLAVAFLLIPSIRPQVESFPRGAWAFWGSVAFWSLLWPWILSGLHRPHAERALRRILSETLNGPPPAAAHGEHTGESRRAS